MRERERKRLLVVDASGLRAGIPLPHVREIMRPLPIADLAGAPPFVLGLAVIRGAPVPVVDLGAVLGRAAPRDTLGRFASLVVDGRALALAVSAVMGIVELEPNAASEMPPLLSRAASEVVDELALSDAALLLVLRSARLVPDLAPNAEGVSA
jgi:purine-binding chemotaxis protein CheW